MTVDTKGVVVTPYKDGLLQAHVVKKALGKLIREERQLVYPGSRPWSKEVSEQFREPEVEMCDVAGMLQFRFTFHGARRTLAMFFYCDGDHLELGPRSISFSMGCSGESELFVSTAVHALSMFGPAYLHPCDTRGEPQLLQESSLSVLDAAALGYICPLDLPRWADFAESYLPTNRDRFLGAPLDEFRKRTSDYTKAREYVKGLPVPVVGYLEDYHQRMCKTA